MTLEEFLAVADQFKLGGLETEAPHPGTARLSSLVEEDLPAALRLLQSVDVAALENLAGRAAAGELDLLAGALASTLADGGRVFLCGCGATGRLSLALETFNREGAILPGEFAGSVIGFMAGGDAALIKSIERFEDHPEFGARQLEELGFGEGDLLVGITEGGETPFVIGATERAAEISRRAPFFLYCNPDGPLAAAAERSRRVIGDPRIHKVNLAVGPMALAGSTRMQATTVQMTAVAYALLHRDRPGELPAVLAALASDVAALDYGGLAALTAEEADIYRRGEFVIYRPGEFGITVLTDTTERSPTFSLAPFENVHRPADPASLCTLQVEGAPDAATAWERLLGRPPRALEWGATGQLTGLATLYGFDISDRLPALREARTGGARHHVFDLGQSPDGLILALGTHRCAIPAAGHGGYGRNLLLKIVLNAHSTALMGRLGRYAGNLMTYVSPSNYKLVDRCVRYVRHLARGAHGVDLDYAEVAREVFAQRARLRPDEPVVLRVLDALVGR